MRTFGPFEGTSEIARTALGQVWRARGPDGQGEKFAAKIMDCGVLSFVANDAAVAARLDVFIEAAQVQAKAASDPESGWAPVHATGRGEDSAYFVTDLLPFSAARLIEGRAAARGQVLVTIVAGIAHALKSMRAGQARWHGNLRASNVFFDRANDLAGARIILSDPCPTRELGPDRGEVADLRAVGQIIYQLVTHEHFEALGGWPVPPGPAWSRLGKVGEGWRELCSELLDPELKPGAIDLDRLAERAQSLTPPPRPLWRYVFAAAAVLSLMVGGWMAWSNRPWKPLDWNDSLWSEVCDNSDWYAAIIEGALSGDVSPEIKRFESKLQGGDQRRKLLGDDPALLVGDPELVGVVETFLRDFSAEGMGPEAWARFAAQSPDVAVADTERALGKYADERTRPVWMLGHARRFAPAVKKSWTTEDFAVFRTERPSAQGAALTQAAYGLHVARFMQQELRASIEAHQAALRAKVETLVSDGPPAPRASAELRGNVERGAVWLPNEGVLADRVRALAMSGRNAAALASSWKSIQEGVASMSSGAAGADPVVAGLLESVRSSVARADDEGGLADVLGALDAWAQSVGGVAPIIAAGAREIDWSVMEQREGAGSLYEAARSGDLPVEGFGQWVALVKDQSYWLVTEARPEIAIEPLLAGAESALGAIDELDRDFNGPQITDISDRIGRLRTDASETASLRWIRRNRDTIVAGTTRLLADAGSLRSETDGLIRSIATSAQEQADRWMSEEPSALTSVRAFQQHWTRERTAIASRVGPAAGGTPSQLRAALRNLRGVLFWDEDPRTHDVLADGWSRKLEAWSASAPESRPVSWDQGGWDAVVGERREHIARQLLASIEGWNPVERSDRWSGHAGMESAQREAWNDAEAWASRSERFASDMRRVERLRNEWHGPEEPVADGGPTLAAVVASWSGDPESAPLLRVASALLADVERAEAIGSEARESLVPILTSATEPGWARFAAWVALGSPDRAPAWPAGAAELATEIQSRDQLVAMIPSIPDEARRVVVGDRIAASGPVRWSSALLQGGPTQLETVMSRRAEMGVTPDAPGLDPAAAIDLAMFEFASGVRRVEDEERVKAMGLALVDRVRPLLNSIEPTGAGAVERSIRGIDEIAGGRDTRKTLQEILAENGPGINPKWTLQSTEGTGPDGQAAPEVIRYNRPGGGVLTFARADVDDPEPVYVCAEEVSIGLAQAIAQSTPGGLSRIREWSKLDAPEDRRGVLTWRLQGPRLAAWIPTTGWWNDSNVSPTDAFPTGMEPPPPPTAETPVNWIEPEAAEHLASLVGCRLPTSAEWKMALAKERSRSPSGPRGNLRDATFTAFTEHVGRLRQTQAQLVFPHAKGAYDAGDVESAPALGATTEDDGSLWFEPQSHPDRGTTYKHLIGNVGEFVDDTPGEKGGYGVVGGSAMSISPNPEATKPIRTRAAFSDVGFRLVFQAKDLKPAMWAAMLKELGPTPPYVFRTGPGR